MAEFKVYDEKHYLCRKIENMLTIGLSHTSETTVSESNTACRYGSGGIDVFATPAMVGLMENAAMTAVENDLPDGCTTVGSLINTTHIKPSKLGAKVRATAVLKEIDGRKLTFKVTAEDDSDIVGEGEHVRYIVDIERFMSKLT